MIEHTIHSDLSENEKGKMFQCEDVYMDHLLFEGLKTLFFVLQLLLHASQVSLQLVHLRHREEKNSVSALLQNNVGVVFVKT